MDITPIVGTEVAFWTSHIVIIIARAGHVQSLLDLAVETLREVIECDVGSDGVELFSGSADIAEGFKRIGCQEKHVHIARTQTDST
jgi:hypothetical protein